MVLLVSTGWGRVPVAVMMELCVFILRFAFNCGSTESVESKQILVRGGGYK